MKWFIRPLARVFKKASFGVKVVMIALVFVLGFWGMWYATDFLTQKSNVMNLVGLLILLLVPITGGTLLYNFVNEESNQSLNQNKN